MPNFSYTISVSTLFVLLTGCATPPISLTPLPDFDTLTSEIRPISTAIRADTLRLRTLAPTQVPGDLDLTTNVKIEREELDEEALKENVTFNRNQVITAAARVVISVPVEEQIEQQRRREARLSNRDRFYKQGRNLTESELADKATEKTQDDSNKFQTNSYFNRAEQQIVKALIGKSFNVQDRSKFEAKLRDLRSKERGTTRSPEKDAEMKILLEQKESGELSSEDYIKELIKHEKRYAKKREEAARNAGNKELTDGSELIRAAQEGEVQSDYILQVNRFHTDVLSDRSIFLVDEPEIDKLCKTHPGLREAFSSQGRSTMTQPGFYGVLNAKLIEVQTGIITWIGEHRVESLRIFKDGYRIIVPIIRRVANGAEIQRAIDRHNKSLGESFSELAGVRRRVTQQAEKQLSDHVNGLQRTHQALAQTVNQISLTIDVEERNRMAKKYNQSVADFVQSAGQQPQASAQLQAGAADYNSRVEALRQRMDQQAPSTTRAAWAYKFIIGSPSTRPRLPSSTRNNSRAPADVQQRLRDREFLDSHYSALAKRVSQELIATIPSK